jgi:hypothetical protein
MSFKYFSIALFVVSLALVGTGAGRVFGGVLVLMPIWLPLGVIWAGQAARNTRRR